MTNRWNELILQVEYDKEEEINLLLSSTSYDTYELVDPRSKLNDADLETWLYFDESIFKDEFDGLCFKLYSKDDDFKDLILEFESRDLGEYRLNSIDESDWENNWKDFYDTMEIGDNIVIKPDWQDYNDSSKTIIDLNPGMAFGTGAHESTELALINLEKYLNEGQSVLDVGTGSGILGICAGLLGSSKVHACDIDEASLEIARKNAKKNDVDITVYKSNLLDNVEDSFDIVLANIVVEVIEEMVGDLRKVLKEDGYFIVSGVLKSKKDRLIKAFQKEGLVVVDSLEKNEWTSLVARFKDV